MTKIERKKLYKLIEEWTRAECMSRCAPITWPEWGEYAYDAQSKADEIRKLMFGECDLFLLADKWGMPTTGRKKKGKKKLKGKGKKNGRK